VERLLRSDGKAQQGMSFHSHVNISQLLKKEKPISMSSALRIITLPQHTERRNMDMVRQIPLLPFRFVSSETPEGQTCGEFNAKEKGKQKVIFAAFGTHGSPRKHRSFSR
jgi:hypothetical protein